MRLPENSEPTWPASWKYSYEFDRHELGGRNARLLGYQYAYRARRDATLALVAQAAAPPARVLDVAAAQGNFSLALAERGYDVTWNDFRSDLEGYVRLKHEFGAIEYLPGNVFEVASKGQWDVVVATEVIEHVAHPDQFLNHLSKLVKPRGYIVLTTPNGAYFRNKLPTFEACPDPSVFESKQFQPDADGHIFLLHPDELRRLSERAGLEIVQFRLFTNPLTNGHVKLGHVLPLLPRGVVEGVERLTRRLPEPLLARIATMSAMLLRRV